MNDDVRNIVAATNIAALFLDRSRRIRLWTPRALTVLSNSPSDHGQLLFDMSTEITCDALAADATRVLDRRELAQREVRGQNGRRYLLRLLPYLTADDHAEGVVIIFTDVAEGSREGPRLRTLLERLVTIQLDERRRISRDLHDQLGQEITAARLALESVTAQPGGGGPLHDALREMLNRIGRLDALLDAVISELRPPALETDGLAPALAALVREWSKKNHIHAEFQCAGLETVRLDPTVEPNVYFIAQEALTNVLKHARATRVGVILERRAHGAVLIVEDNGCGFDPEAQLPRRSFGLIGMRERADLIGGHLEIESSPDKGTSLLLHLPPSQPAGQA